LTGSFFPLKIRPNVTGGNSVKRKNKGPKTPAPRPEKAEDLYPILSKKPFLNLNRDTSYLIFFILWFLGFVVIFIRYYEW